MKLPKEENIVYNNGNFVSEKDAMISIFDSGFLSGDAIFEGLRIHNGRFFKLEEHLDMLWESAKALDMDLTFTRNDLKKAIQDIAKKNNMKEEGYLRIQITRGKMLKPFMNPALAAGKSSLVIIPDKSTSKEKKGSKIITSSIRRISPDMLDQKIHSCNKLNSLLAKLQANYVGVDEALMLDENGFVAECSTTNIFFVKNGKIITPHPKSCKLGVTRQTILDGVSGLGYDSIEKDISLYDAYNCDESFYCGTHGGITPVIEIDGRKIGDGQMGPITNEIIAWYHKLCNSEN